MPKGVIGNPRFSRGDEVSFVVNFKEYDNDYNEVTTSETMTGEVYIVDTFGTFFIEDEPCYDVWVNNFRNSGQKCLVKHIRESSIL